MPARPLAAALGLAVAALAALPAAAASVSDRFDVYFGGVRAGVLDLQLKLDGNRYQAQSRLETAGVVGALYDASYVAHAKGALGGFGTSVKPELFEAKTTYGGKKQDLQITFGASAPTSVEADPPYKPKPYEIKPQAQTGVLDPLSAAVALLKPEPIERLCDREANLFDGRKRSRIKLAKPVERDGVWRCDATFTRVAGYRPKDMAKRDFPFRVYFDKGPDGLSRLRQVVVETDYGVAVANRR